MPAASPAKPRFDRVENALVTAEGYRHLAALSTTPAHRAAMERSAAAWARRARSFEQEEFKLGLTARAKPSVNPCVRLYGPGPARARCAGCAFLHAHVPGNRMFHQCELRVFSRSQRPDHRMRWPACARYQPKES